MCSSQRSQGKTYNIHYLLVIILYTIYWCSGIAQMGHSLATTTAECAVNKKKSIRFGNHWYNINSGRTNKTLHGDLRSLTSKFIIQWPNKVNETAAHLDAIIMYLRPCSKTAGLTI